MAAGKADERAADKRQRRRTALRHPGYAQRGSQFSAAECDGRSRAAAPHTTGRDSYRGVGDQPQKQAGHLRGQVFTKEQIYRAVWSEDYLLDDSNIMAFIRKLRKKIEPDPDAPKYILTIWGIGYKMNDQL